MANDDDDIFGFESEKSEKKIDNAPIVSDVPPVVEVVPTPVSDDENFPKLMGTSYPKEFLELITRVKTQYDNLPLLDYDSMYKEMTDLTVRSCPTPTLQIINQELQKVQAAKERLSEIMVDIIKCHSLKKRIVDILSESWGNFSSEKSADKRKGDSVFRLSDFDMDFGRVDASLRVATQISRNLESLQENLSRRITIFQLQLKLHDIGRGALPDFEFKDDFTDSISSLQGDIKKDPLEANSQSF